MNHSTLTVVAVLLLASGCSLIGNLDRFNGAVAEQANTDSNDAEGPTITDSGPDSLDAAAGIEAGALDAPLASDAWDAAEQASADAPTDAGVDAPVDAPDASDSAFLSEGSVPTSWCAANSTASTAFCRDFDDGKAYGYLFSSANVSLVASAPAPAIISTVWVSPPSSLLLSMPFLAACAADAGTNCSENIQLSTNVLSHSFISLQFAIQLVNYDPNNVHDLSLVRIAYDNGQWAATWDLQGYTSSVNESVVPPAGGLANTIAHKTSMPPLGSWIDVVFTVDVAAQVVSFSFNGSQQFRDPIAAPAIAGPVAVTVGVNSLVGPAPPMSLFYDNILVTTD